MNNCGACRGAEWEERQKDAGKGKAGRSETMRREGEGQAQKEHSETHKAKDKQDKG